MGYNLEVLKLTNSRQERDNNLYNPTVTETALILL